MRGACALITLIAIVAAGAADAAIPRTLNYQGVLTDPNGVPLDGDYELTFRIYTAPTGGTPLWQETDSLTVAHGVFNAVLGKTTPLDLPFDEAYWLGTTVGVGSELSPRAELTASPYAMRAAVADSVVGGGGGGGIGGSGTANQVAKFTGATSIGNSIICETGSNVGIGSGFTSPTSRLQIHSGEAVIRLTTPSSGSAWNDGLQIGPMTNNSLSYDVWNREDGWLRFGTSNSERMVIESDGDVGIGVNPPAAKLHVAAYGGSANFRLQNTHVDGDSWEFQSGITGLSDHYLGIKNIDASTLAMIVQPNGYVGIGTTSGPTEKLQVTGTVHSTTGGFKFPDGTVQTTAAGGGGGIGGGGTAGWIPKFTGTGTTIGNSVVRESASGDVGLQATPAATLHVHKSSDTAAIRLTDGNTGTSSTDGLEISLPGGYTDAQIWNRENGELSFGTSGIERMSIAAGGQVSIANSVDVTSSSTPALRSLCTLTGNTHAIAVDGISNPAPGYGFGGYFQSTGCGVKGAASDLVTGGQTYTGVDGSADALTGTVRGVYGYAASVNGGTKYGVKGYVQGPGTNYAVYGSHGGGAGTYYAGYFDGDVHVTGTLTAGNKAFKIDHPLDPANKYLIHYCTESDEMQNVYSGNVTLDGSGEAWVVLPEWFGSVNRDFRYQLTPIGAYAPLYVASEIENNRFSIAGGAANMKVSWQVAAVRSDAYAEKNMPAVEEEKQGRERGRYLHPELYGMPASSGMSEEPEDERK